MSTMKENPYFDSNPEWLFVAVKIWFLISLVTAGIGFYLVLFKSQDQSTTYRRLTSFHLAVGMIFELEYGVLSPSLLYFPYVAVENRGALTTLGVPPSIQCSLLINIVCIIIANLCPIFYHRMEILLPDGHALNKKAFRYAVYTVVYGFFYIALFPLLVLAMNYEPQDIWKEKLIEEYGIHYENFWNPAVFVMVVHTNPWAQLVFVLILIFTLLLIEIVFGCIYVIYHTLQSPSCQLSMKRKHDHKAALSSLIALTLVLSSIVLSLIASLLYFFYFSSPRADIANIFIAMAGGAHPISLVVYFMSYKPYRKCLLGFFKKEKVAPRRNSSIAVTNVKLDW